MSFTTNRPVWITLPTLLLPGDYLPRGVRAVPQDTFQCSGTAVRHDNSARLFALHFSVRTERESGGLIYEGRCGPDWRESHRGATLLLTPPSVDFILMHTPTILQRLGSDVSQNLYSINDLALDEDCEIFLHLGLLGFLASFIWFMNSKWSWQEVFTMLNGVLSVLCEGFLPNYS